jgi:hypothetical protein
LAKARGLYEKRLDRAPFERCRSGDRWQYAQITTERKEQYFRFQVLRGIAEFRDWQFVPTKDKHTLLGIRSSSFTLDPDVIANQKELEYYLGAVMVEMIEDDWIFAPHPKRRCWYAVEFVRKY